MAFRWVSGRLHFYVERRIANWNTAIIDIDYIPADIVRFVGDLVGAVFVVDRFRGDQKTFGILRVKGSTPFERGWRQQQHLVYLDQYFGMFVTRVTRINTKVRFQRGRYAVAYTRSVNDDLLRLEVRQYLNVEWTGRDRRDARPTGRRRVRRTSVVPVDRSK